MALRCELQVTGMYSLTPSTIDTYNRIISAHGLGMVFLFIMPLLISFLGNWQLPQSYLSTDFALPRINILSLWFLIMALEVLLCAISREEGIGAGWTLYPPLSDSSYHSSSAMSLLVFAVHVLGLSSEGGSATFLVSLLVARSAGSHISSWCLLTHTILTVSILLILTLPVLGTGVTLLLIDRLISSTILSTELSGDPLVFQHLFWYFGHPEVYVIILPAFGMISWTLSASTRSSSPQHLGMCVAIYAIGLIGFFVWAHHMYITGLSEDSRLYFSSATMIIAIPTAIKIFSWLASFSSPMIWSLEPLTTLVFVSCFTLGGFTGLLLANSSLDILYHDTYYVVGHFHYVLSIAAAIAALLSLRWFIWSSLSRAGVQVLARLFLLFGLSSINWMFGLQHPVGVGAHPRRVISTAESTILYTQLSNVAITGLLTLPYALTISGDLPSSPSRSFSAGCLLSPEIASHHVSSSFLDRRSSVHEF